jgi:hypothetical protein
MPWKFFSSGPDSNWFNRACMDWSLLRVMLGNDEGTRSLELKLPALSELLMCGCFSLGLWSGNVNCMGVWFVQSACMISVFEWYDMKFLEAEFIIIVCILLRDLNTRHYWSGFMKCTGSLACSRYWGRPSRVTQRYTEVTAGLDSYYYYCYQLPITNYQMASQAITSSAKSMTPVGTASLSTALALLLWRKIQMTLSRYHTRTVPHQLPYFPHKGCCMIQSEGRNRPRQRLHSIHHRHTITLPPQPMSNLTNFESPPTCTPRMTSGGRSVQSSSRPPHVNISNNHCLNINPSVLTL